MGTSQNDIQQIVRRRLGIDLAMQRGLQLSAVIERVAAGNPSDYLARLRAEPESGPAWQALISELTIGETYFFRHRAQFDMLRERIVPALVARRAKSKRVRVWCAGCATGEEAYSVALLLLDLLPGWSVQVVGTDLCQQALQTARRGVYQRQWSFRHHADDTHLRYWRLLGDNPCVPAPVRERVTFRWMNLLTAPPQPRADIILCRNVMLYFDKAARHQAEKLLYTSLAADGWLLLGQSEALYSQRGSLEMVAANGALAYHRPATEPPTAPARLPQTGEHIRLTGSLPSVTPANRDDLYRRAVAAFHAEAHARAERLLSELLAEWPKDVPGRVLLGAVFANRGAAHEAQMHLNTALLHDPLYADAHYLRALLYLESQETQKAQEALDNTLYSQIGHPLACYLMGTLMARQDNCHRARSLWRQALAVLGTQPPDQPVSDLTPRTAKDFAVVVQKALIQLG